MKAVHERKNAMRIQYSTMQKSIVTDLRRDKTRLVKEKNEDMEMVRQLKEEKFRVVSEKKSKIELSK